ncbi:hypothetical protein [Kangiella taiwanensis]|uniref:DUF3019 domain-containing protein n=1 Tax=Kangiella taiwanensis TaxID=1079179 RepID=A0ABP8I162_9GAMM|nr:hypothetical protein [Kangiella taiwanensis]
MKKILFILITLLPFSAMSTEMFIFDRKIELPETCMMIIPSKNNSFIDGANLYCNYQDKSTLELTINQSCNIQLFTDAVNETGEKLAVARKEHGVSYMEFHLKDKNNGTPVFLRVIRDESHCLITKGTSLKSIKDITKTLWFIGD